MYIPRYLIHSFLYLALLSYILSILEYASKL